MRRVLHYPISVLLEQSLSSCLGSAVGIFFFIFYCNFTEVNFVLCFLTLKKVKRKPILLLLGEIKEIIQMKI